MAQLLKPLGFLTKLIPLSERSFAKRTSLSVLEIYWRVREAQPELNGKALYAEVVATRSHVDLQAARMIVQRAEQSFAEWPEERDVIFRDVVDYLVFDEFMQAHPDRRGAQSDMRRVAAKIIPENL